MTTYQHDTDGCAVFVPTDTAYDLDGDGDDETPTQVAYLCDAGGANVQDLSFHTEGSCFNDFYSRDQLLSYLTNDDGKVSTLKEKFDPSFETETPGTTYINNNPNLRACGSGMYSMFRGARSFNQPLNNWNVSNVEDMEGMFQNAISFNQPLHAPWYA